MTSTTVRTFVDTNIWVYALDSRDPDKRARALEALGTKPSGIVVSTQVLGELYVTVRRLGTQVLSVEDARTAVEALRRFTVVPVEDAHVTTALDLVALHHISYWDALVVAAAQSAGCSRMLSEDLTAGGVYGGVRIENPFSPARRVSEAAAPYRTGQRSWDDAELLWELTCYEQAAKEAGMRPSSVHSYWDYARRFLAWRTGDYRPRGASDVGSPGSSAPRRPVPRGPADADALDAQAAAYAATLERAGRESTTVDTYQRHAMFFVRWLRDDFRPGGRLRSG
jgi:predicted nucleic acid-binding protein